MPQFVLSNLELQIDNVSFKTIANSEKFSDGLGVYTVSTAVGGTVAIPVIGLNLEEAVGMISFSLPVTQDNVENMRAIKVIPGVHTVRLTDPNTTFSRVMTEGTIVNEMEINIGHDGSFEVEFRGQPLTGS